MKSKLISLLIILAASILTLAACGSAQPAPESAPPADTTEEEAAPAADADAEAEADTEAPAEAEASIQVTNPDGYDINKCFVAAPANDGTVQYEAKPGPYKIAVSNSFIGNDWRTQMIQM
ncbi:MAG: hypothetical protein KDI79_00835, partial [Anaerolineae bacterium]|nr:hypothetical protein [Anaerolineae bacterium]